MSDETRIVLEGLLAVFKQADDERLEETHAAHREAAKWEAEGDMYGWNFHEGLSSGITWGSIIFHRVQRSIEAMIRKGDSDRKSVLR